MKYLIAIILFILSAISTMASPTPPPDEPLPNASVRAFISRNGHCEYGESAFLQVIIHCPGKPPERIPGEAKNKYLTMIRLDVLRRGDTYIALYRLTPHGVGRIPLQPFPVIIDGHRYTSGPLVLHVHDDKPGKRLTPTAL